MVVRNSSVIGRVAALGALGVIAVAVAVLLLSGGSSYQVKAIYANASQIVSGDTVQVSGNTIGTVSHISLTPSGQAEITLTINNTTFAPLREATKDIIRHA